MTLLPTVGIIDYGFGNVSSVLNALREIGLEPRVVTSGSEIQKEDRLLLPGVGAFPSAMKVIRERGLDEAVIEAIARGKKLLGVCLGMQLLFQRGHEFGDHDGIGVFEGSVAEIVHPDEKSSLTKSTHIAWKTVAPSQDGELSQWFSENQRPFYFVHSFAAVPEARDIVAGTAEYSGKHFVAAVERGNVAGVQFHPERSGENGLQFLFDFFSSK